METIAQLDSGRLWSMLRAVLEQGAAIQQDYAAGKYPSYEHYAARIDEVARERADALTAALAAERGIEWPEEPSEEMLDAGERAQGNIEGNILHDSFMRYLLRHGYKAMRAAHVRALASRDETSSESGG